jgi:hypothetical protein
MKIPQQFRTLGRYGFLLILTATIAVSCDTLESDSVENQPAVALKQSPIIVFPQTSGLIDLNALLVSSTSNHTFSVSTQPKLGTLESINDFLLKYTPNDGIKEGQDSFVLSVFGNNNVIVEKDTIIIIIAPDSSAYPCGVYAFDDFVQDLFPDSTAIIDVRANDTACVTGVSSLQVTLLEGDTSVSAMHGTAEVLPGGKIKYTPGSSFTTHDRFFYKITKPAGIPDAGDAEESSIAIVYIQGWLTCTALPLPKEDTLFVSYENLVYVDSMTFDTLYHPGPYAFNVLANDFYCEQNPVTIDISSVPNGKVTVGPGINVQYTFPDYVPYGFQDSFVYRICTGQDCAEARAYVIVR